MGIEMGGTQMQCRAVVVDDDSIARKMMVFALQQEGFVCHSASDGEEALQLLEDRRYDLVVTDLIMPHKNGHALVVEMLGLSERPFIAVHTSVVVPAITKDLVNRGVDDIVFKPTDYAAFAAKMKVLVEKRVNHHRLELSGKALESSDDLERKADPTLDANAGRTKEIVGIAGVNESTTSVPRLDKSSAVKSLQSTEIEFLPFSHFALEACRVACEEDSEAEDIAAAIEQEPALTAALLRLGNSSLYNRTASKILNLEDIIVRVGRRSIGELALALDACDALRVMGIPFLDVKLAWKRSLAARVAAKLLMSQRVGMSTRAGISLSSAMHLLGRMMLAKKFPEEMVALIELANQTGDALTELERQAFSESQSAMLARLLSTWNIPQDIIGPLEHLDSNYSELVSLNRVDRDNAELVKIAVLIGWLAVGKWEPWDLVEIPPSSVFRHHCSTSLREIVNRTRDGLAEALAGLGEKSSPQVRGTKEIACNYRCAGGADIDFIREILPSLGVVAGPSGRSDPTVTLVNGLDASPERINTLIQARERNECVLLTVPELQKSLTSGPAVVLFPCTFGRLAKSIQALNVQRSEARTH
ncbi:HDOD domain-containing protein [Novipirellula sp.]|uniref:HDOD domain-containing protein n=1 Tax=Novipirellula sp. TaxID=2795430 RepID=UPI003565E19F